MLVKSPEKWWIFQHPLGLEVEKVVWGQRLAKSGKLINDVETQEIIIFSSRKSTKGEKGKFCVQFKDNLKFANYPSSGLRQLSGLGMVVPVSPAVLYPARVRGSW